MWAGGQPAQCFISASSRRWGVKKSNYGDVLHREYPPTFLHTTFCTSRNTHLLLKRHQWTYSPCKVFPEISLYLLSPKHCVNIEHYSVRKNSLLFVLNPFPLICTGIHSSSYSFRKEHMITHCSSFLIVHPSVV